MTDKPYPNDLLTDIATQIAEWELTPEQIRDLAADLPREVGAIMENRAEENWYRWSIREPDDSAYRTDMINAGRGHLLR
jgi:hypothetical protein